VLLPPAGMASAAVKERLTRLGQGVLQPSAGLAALAAVLRSASGLISLSAPSATLAGAAGAAVVTVNPFKWDTYLGNMQVGVYVDKTPESQQLMAPYCVAQLNSRL